MNIFLSTPVDTAREAAARGNVSLMAYRMGAGFHLYRTLLPQGRFPLMDVDCAGFTGYGPHEVLISELLRECRGRGFQSVVLGLSGPPEGPVARFCRLFSEAMEREGLTLYLPLPCASCSETARLLVPAGELRGGFRKALGELCTQYGPGRLAVELERVYTDFPLPVRGPGTVLPADRFRELCRDVKAFYSPELLCRTCSFRRDGQVHLVLWDDAESLSEKLRVMAELGVGAAFLYYPHVKDIFDKISGR